jgi:hypothetical protein
MVASPPSHRLLEGELPCSIEYLYHPSAQRVKELQASFDGPLGLAVRIPKLNIDRVYAVRFKEDDSGVPIAVEGSPYTLTPGGIARMPMKSKGYEDTESEALTVGVVRKDADKDFTYDRMSLSRYPERSPDFVMENGERKRKQDGVDPGIQIDFQDASRPQIWIVEAEDGTLSLISRTTEGKSSTTVLSDKPVQIPMEGIKTGLIEIRVAQHLKDAVPVMLPQIIPPEQRPRGQTVMEVMQFSIVNVEVGKADGWKQSNVYVPFSPYAQIGDSPEGKHPTVVDVPGKGKVGLLLATIRRPLPSRVTLVDFKPVKYPGATHSYEDYISTLKVETAGAEPRTLISHLNKPATDHGIYYFQAAWDGDDNAPADKRFSVIGVANRPGIHFMVAGAILIALGIGFAFYVKPLLLKFKKESLAKWAKANR